MIIGQVFDKGDCIFYTRCKIWISHYAGSYYIDWIYSVDSQGRTISMHLNFLLGFDFNQQGTVNNIDFQSAISNVRWQAFIHQSKPQFSLFHMSITAGVTKSSHQDRGPCYLHLPIFFFYMPSSLPE